MSGVSEIAKKVKLIVCDIDGTLLNSEHKLSERTVETIKQAKRQGIQTTIASGRSLYMLWEYITRLDITCPVISINGAQIISPSDGRVINEITVPFEKFRPYIEFCAENHADYVVMSDETLCYGFNTGRYVFSRKVAEDAERLGFPFRYPDVVAPDFSNIAGRKICKVVVMLTQPGERELLEGFVDANTDFNHTMSSGVLFEVFDRRVDKGFGVRSLASAMGLAPDEVCVFGDYDNDLPMFSACSLPVAMGNAPEYIKKSAAYVTASNDEDGVALAIEKLFLR